jgi:hypothetical protein
VARGATISEILVIRVGRPSAGEWVRSIPANATGKAKALRAERGIEIATTSLNSAHSRNR